MKRTDAINTTNNIEGTFSKLVSDDDFDFSQKDISNIAMRISDTHPDLHPPSSRAKNNLH